MSAQPVPYPPHTQFFANVSLVNSKAVLDADAHSICYTIEDNKDVHDNVQLTE